MILQDCFNFQYKKYYAVNKIFKYSAFTIFITGLCFNKIKFLFTNWIKSNVFMNEEEE